ncbi:unnamed protein product [Oikopleura dioica]|uniref:Uncharacterized protein n=1 Tax=Oikopleura dioica TaxID=34765 RepID=E4XUL1_OIKDI|nr:unnamed protein product [Oikopleura dioica]
MSNQAPPSTTYSESNLTNTTPPDFNQSQNVNAQGLSEAAINQLIDQKMQSILNALGKSVQERAQMQIEIDALKTSEQELKNKVENVTLNNEQLVERVEKVEIENAQLKQMLNEMEISGQIKRLKKAERDEWKNETRKIEDKKKALDLNLREEIEKKQDLYELTMMRKELGEIGGAGHFFGNDKKMEFGGKRDEMEEEELKKVLHLLAAGEKKINLKEREFRAFLNEKNGKKLKKSFRGFKIWRSPRLDGRSSSRLIGKKKEEMEKISISGFRKKKEAPNSMRRRNKLIM